MHLICRERLLTIPDVRHHLWTHRDDLSRCVLGFSGGKDSVALAKMVQEVNPDVPLIYVGCPGCEWPEHESFLRQIGVTFIDSGHNWDWFALNRWAFLHTESTDAERWAKLHHRGHLRRYARSGSKVLLWGNRTADGNTVPAVRYAGGDGVELWMPLRDLSTAHLNELLSERDRSPIYRLQSCRGTGFVSGRLRYGVRPEDRKRDAGACLDATNMNRFMLLYRDRFDVAVEPSPHCR